MSGDVLANRMIHVRIFGDATDFDRALQKMKNIQREGKKK